MDLSTHPRTRESHLNPGASSESLSQSLPPPHGEVPKPTGTSETSRTASVSPGPKPGQKKPAEVAALLKARLRTPADPAPMLLRGRGLSPRPEWGDHPHAGASEVPAKSQAAVCLHQEARATAESPGTASASWGHCKTRVQGLGESEPRSTTAVCPEGPLETTGQLGRGWRSRARPPPTAQDSAHPPVPGPSQPVPLSLET